MTHPRLILVVLLGLVAPVSIGWYFVANGAVFGEGPVHYARAIVVAVGLLVVALAVHGTTRVVGMDTLAAAGAFTAGLYGLTGIFMPGTPDDVSVAPCHGQPLSGSQFKVVVADPGLTVRSGASTSASQIGRLEPGCAVGLNGYCPGRPIGDVLLGKLRQDSRWFRLNTLDGVMGRLAGWTSGASREIQFVAGGRLETQISTGSVDLLPADLCHEYSALAPPGQLRGHFNLDRKNAAVTGDVSADRTFDFGYALVIDHSSRIGSNYVQLPTRTDWMSATAQWTAYTLSGSLRRSTPVSIVAARCWASGAPVLDASRPKWATFRVARGGAILRKLPKTSLDHDVAVAAQQVACQQYAA